MIKIVRHEDGYILAILNIKEEELNSNHFLENFGYSSNKALASQELVNFSNKWEAKAKALNLPFINEVVTE